MGAKTAMNEDAQEQEGVDWLEEEASPMRHKPMFGSSPKSALEKDTDVAPMHPKRLAVPPPPLPPQRRRQRPLDQKDATTPCEPPHPAQPQHVANLWNATPPPPPPPRRHVASPSEEPRSFKEQPRSTRNGFQYYEEGLEEHQVQARHIEEVSKSTFLQHGKMPTNTAMPPNGIKMPKVKGQMVRSALLAPSGGGLVFHESQGLRSSDVIPRNVTTGSTGMHGGVGDNGSTSSPSGDRKKSCGMAKLTSRCESQPKALFVAPAEIAVLARPPPVPPTPPAPPRTRTRTSVVSDGRIPIEHVDYGYKQSSTKHTSNSRSRSQSSRWHNVSKGRSVSPTTTVCEGSTTVWEGSQSYFSGKVKRAKSWQSSSSSNATASKDHLSRKSWRSRSPNTHPKQWESKVPESEWESKVPESEWESKVPESECSETDPEDRELSPTILVCEAFLKGRCHNFNCESRHPPTLIDRGKPWLEKPWMKRGLFDYPAVKPPEVNKSIEDTKPPEKPLESEIVTKDVTTVATKVPSPYEPPVEMSEVCAAFLEGKCADVECKLRHFPSGDEELIEWQTRFGGRLPCRWGIACRQKRCRYQHLGGDSGGA